MNGSRSDKKVRIVVIDSGCFPHKDITCRLEGVGINFKDNTPVVTNDIQDKIGHGTAITFLINKYLPEASIYIIRIYEDEYCRPELLMSALEYIDKNLECDIINISLGITVCAEIQELRELCNRLTEKGIVIVSAFDNNGTLSYPAAFSNVIGVDVSNNVGNILEYEYVENSPVNIRGFYREQRLPWLHNEYQVVSGASFIAPYITINVAKILLSGIKELSKIKEKLRITATNIISCDKPGINQVKLPNRAIVFPFNKEIHSLARYESQLKFDICGFFDVKYIGNIGKSVSEIIGGESCSHQIVRNYKKIDWLEDFDTIILGHTGELSNIINFNYKKYFLEKALEYNKSVFSFDFIPEEDMQLLKKKGLNVYYPRVTTEDVPKYNLGKLRKIGKPIVAIVGTGPRQGKFTLQLGIKDVLEQSGYNVGMLGTEPSALLFGFDEVYPMGYASTVETNGIHSISVINEMVGRIEDKGAEIIVVGSQSQSIPFTDGSLKYYPVAQHEFVLGTAPDIYVLCINLMDDFVYIKRTINYLENIFESKVIALAALPLDYPNKWSVISNKRNPLDRDEFAIRKKMIEENFKLRLYNIANMDDIVELAEQIVYYFSDIS